VTPEEAIDRAKNGDLGPVYLLTGDEPYLVEKVLATLREAALAGGIPHLNEEKLVAGEIDVDRVVAAARMLPMMAKRRLIVVRSLERWDGRGQDESTTSSEDPDPGRMSALDRLAEYAQNPAPSTCLVLIATKVDGRRKIMSAARKAGWLVV
jgi:DNA polymerase-3 subunit delta